MWSREAADRALRRAGVLLLIGIVERLLFTRFAALPRQLARRRLKDVLELIEREFDARLYLRQIRSAYRRSRALRDPLLHYAILGWRERRAPNARFDPNFYRESTPELARSEEPFQHYLQSGRAAGAAQSEAEAARRRYPTATPSSFALVLHHNRGGGSSRFLALYEAGLVAAGIYPLRLRVLSNGLPSLVVCEEPGGTTHVFDLIEDRDKLVAFAKKFGVTRILVNHVIDQIDGVFSWTVALSKELGAPFDVILHDYFTLCPRVNLVDFRGRFCGVAPAPQCQICLSKAGEAAGVEVSAWRSEALEFLHQAREVIAPSDDLAQRLAAFFSGPIAVWEPDSDDATPPMRNRPLEVGEALKIAIIGRLNDAKGAEAVCALAHALRTAQAPIELHLIGLSDRDRRLRAAGVKIWGRYRERDLPATLEAIGPHLAFIPSIWPETWSFVLTHALREGLPTAVFDLGAPAARLRALGRTELLFPLEFAEQPDQLLERFLLYRGSIESPAHADSPNDV